MLPWHATQVAVIAGGLTGWINGDFNYDGKVNVDDYTTVIDLNIRTQGAPFVTAASVGDVVVVPEPVGALFYGACAGALLVRGTRLKRSRANPPRKISAKPK